MPPANPTREFLLSLVTVKGDDIVADSRGVAERFGRRHDHVLPLIEKLIAETTPEDSRQDGSPHNPLFHKDKYLNSQNKPQPFYHITAIGMPVLVGRMKGKVPAAWMVLYAKAFHMMGDELHRLGALRLDVEEMAKTCKVAAEGWLASIEETKRLEAANKTLAAENNALTSGVVPKGEGIDAQVCRFP